MERYLCECGTVFYRYPDRLTSCPTCLQVVLDVGRGDFVETLKAFK